MTHDEISKSLSVLSSQELVDARAFIDTLLRKRYETARKEANDERPFLSRRGSKPKKERKDKGVKKGPRIPKSHYAGAPHEGVDASGLVSVPL